MKNKALKSVLILFAVAAIFATGLYIGKVKLAPVYNGEQVVINKEKGKPQNVDFGLFWDTWQKLEDNFANKDKLDKEQMLYGAISGMVNSLGDPYTVFMDPKETERFSSDIEGSFEGIGAELGMKNSIVTVIAPLPNTPAEKAGIKAGDKIIKVDDIITMDLSLDEVVDKIRGQKGTEVALTIVRGEKNDQQVIKITRGTIEVPSLKWEMKDNKIAVISFYQFSENAAAEFKKSANEALKGGAQKLVIDLRNNPGGYLDAAIKVSSYFVDKGKIVVSEEAGDRSKEDHKAEGGNFLKDIPTVILVNEGSASASEIVAGALKDQNQIKLIGKKTFGKGSVQTVEDLKGGSSIKITIAKWLTPSGVCINQEGIKPDIEVELTDEDYKTEKDPQMEKAMKELLN